MAVTQDSFTAGRLRQRLGADPPLRAEGGYALPGANLARLSLTKAQLAGADLRGANLRTTDLQRANLAGACLVGADLREARLQDADLSGADLQDARLDRAVLDGTVVDGARFDGVDLAAVQIRRVLLWRAGVAPAAVAEHNLGLAALFELGPERCDPPELLAWCVLLGGDDERWAVKAALAARPWRAWRHDLQAALERLEQRLGALSTASLSRARPERLDDRSLSRSPDPAAAPQGSSLTWLRTWRQQRQDATPPTEDDDR